MLEGVRRRGLAAAVTALAAVALAAAVAGRGCGSEDDTPEGAVRAFAAAARAGDRQTMYELFGPATRRWLAAAAERASQLVGGSRRYQAIDLINAGSMAGPVHISVRENKDGRARVEIVDEHGNRSTVDVVEVEGRWRVELAAQLEGSEP